MRRSPALRRFPTARSSLAVSSSASSRQLRPPHRRSCRVPRPLALRSRYRGQHRGRWCWWGARDLWGRFQSRKQGRSVVSTTRCSDRDPGLDAAGPCRCRSRTPTPRVLLVPKTGSRRGPRRCQELPSAHRSSDPPRRACLSARPRPGRSRRWLPAELLGADAETERCRGSSPAPV